MSFLPSPPPIIRSWGGMSSRPGAIVPAGNFRFPSTLPSPFLAYGLQRSYGDCALLSAGTLISTRDITHILSFDPVGATITVQAGATLSSILRYIVPRGFFLPVVPGTALITVGGAIANDIHGKNHHAAGSFGHHVVSLCLSRSDGQVIQCSLASHPDLFRATIGGVGLTGLITSATLRLQPIVSPLLQVHSTRFATLDDFVSLTAATDGAFTHTVAWIDALSSHTGRGVFMAGRFSSTPAPLRAHSGLALTIPPLPISPLRPTLLRAFNHLYYHRAPATPTLRLSHYHPFFFPLDALHRWDRLYGRRGFIQFQTVVPPQNFAAISDLISCAARAGQGSFLAVLKKFGDMPSLGYLSFPRPGYTLVIDFRHQGASTLALLSSMAAIARAAGGAFYTAKDAGYQTPADFRAGYPGLALMQPHIDPAFVSMLSTRLGVHL